ncbi:MAG: phosphoglycolate phosphatase [Gaiellaceae bacterium]|nr:phosphoglycolate phosphatase [Gaiellaceae bacterium]
MNWLVLFDVDGTLLLTHDEVYVEASRMAMEEVFGTSADGPDVPGDTAPAHIRRALRSAGLPEAEIDAGLPRWCETFCARYVHLLEATDTSHWQLAPHAFEAAAALEHRALLTGNPPVVAHARMERLGLAELFPRGQGAFGCERENRIELFDLARGRAGDWPARSTVGVGDTPLDVSSAHAAGCRSIAVTTGNYGRDELDAADAVIASLGELESELASLA